MGTASQNPLTEQSLVTERSAHWLDGFARRFRLGRARGGDRPVNRIALRAILALLTLPLTATVCSAGAQRRPGVVVTTSISCA